MLPDAERKLAVFYFAAFGLNLFRGSAFLLHHWASCLSGGWLLVFPECGIYDGEEGSDIRGCYMEI